MGYHGSTLLMVSNEINGIRYDSFRSEPLMCRAQTGPHHEYFHFTSKPLYIHCLLKMY